MSKSLILIESLAVEDNQLEIPKSIPVSPEALQEKTEALENMEGVIAVESEEDAKTAIQICAAAKGLARGMETSAKRLRDPFNEMSKLIKRTADDFAEELNLEVVRIEKMLTAFEVAKRQREQAERQRQLDEIARKQREAEEANRILEEQLALERLAAEAAENARQEEAQRIKDAEAEAAAAKGKKAKAEAEKALAYQREAAANSDKKRKEEEEQLALERQAAEEAAMDKANEAEDLMVAAASAAAPARSTSGGSTRPKLDFEVLDELALFAAYPSAFNLELKRQHILDLLAMGTVGIPGIRVFDNTKFHVKAATSTTLKLK